MSEKIIIIKLIIQDNEDKENIRKIVKEILEEETNKHIRQGFDFIINKN